MSRLLCCLRARHDDMGAALSHPQEGDACDGGMPAAPPTMADVIRERKKKAGGAGLGTLRRRLAAAARRPRDPRDARPDRGCEHARFIRSVVSSWSLAEVFLVCEQLEAGAALRDLATQAELAREPAAALHRDLAAALRDRWWCDVELVGAGGWAVAAHRALLSARCSYFRQLLTRHSNSVRVPLEGAGAALSREEAAALVWALYAGPAALPAALCPHCAKWERGMGSDADLDIISIENSASRASSGCGGGGGGGGGACSCGRGAAALRRLAALLGFSLDSLHHDMRYLLDSGELCDVRLVWRVEGGEGGGGGEAGGGGGCEGGAAYGFRSALELPCHRLLLAARSRFFRSVLSRRGAVAGVGVGGGVCVVCVDEKVLPRRFARALLHAAYTDQVDLSLIGRSSTSPSAATPTANSGTARAGAARGSSAAALEDAFQLYEIARFLEMGIVVQGCEDAVSRALCPDTLPAVLRWSAAPHASAWVHRQAMRYLRDEFPTVMSHAAAARLPRAALAEALGSPFLQASEPAALRAVLRYADRAHDAAEPNVVWHASQSLGRRGGLGGGLGGRGARGARRRSGGEGAAREALAALLPLVRLEHLPHDHDLLLQVIRRGLVTGPLPSEEVSSAAAWLGRGGCRPARCFLPYLDEIKALVEEVAVPEAELALARRARLAARIPDTLYMVAAARERESLSGGSESGAGGGGGGGGGGVRASPLACVSPRTLASLRARVRELRAAPPAASALRLHAADDPLLQRQYLMQIALRAVRELSLPDSCADLLLQHADSHDPHDRERAASACDSASSEWEAPPAPAPASASAPTAPTAPSAQLCRSSTGSGSLRNLPANIASLESSRSSRRELRPGEPALARSCVGGRGLRLSAAVPDVAMAPNANTHLLTARDLYAHHKHAAEYGGVGVGGGGGVGGVGSMGGVGGVGGVLQLDLGDGATHTPRPGSRAQRAAAHTSRHREHSQVNQVMSCVRGRSEDEELRVAIELSVIRAYSSLGSSGTRRPPPAFHADLLPPAPDFAAIRSRATPSPSPLSGAGLQGAGPQGPGAGLAGGSGLGGARRRVDRHTPPPRLALSRVSSSESRSAATSASTASTSLSANMSANMSGNMSGNVSASRSGSPTPTPSSSPRLRHYRHEYRAESQSRAGCSRGHSPSYA